MASLGNQDICPVKGCLKAKLVFGGVGFSKLEGPVSLAGLLFDSLVTTR
jgi:hypothetical protein